MAEVETYHQYIARLVNQCTRGGIAHLDFVVTAIPTTCLWIHLCLHLFPIVHLVQPLLALNKNDALRDKVAR